MNYLHPTDHFDLVVMREDRGAAEQSLADAPATITSVCIWHTGLRDLRGLHRLTSLETLLVASWPESSLGLVARLPALRRLGILHFPGVRDLNPLAGHARLEHIELRTLPSWDASSKRQLVASLAPLGSIATLRALSMWGVRTQDNKLADLASARRLSDLEFGDEFPLASIAELAVLRPDLEDPHLQAVQVIDHVKCDACGEPRAVLRGLKGTRKRAWVCTRCNPERIAQHRDEFERLKGARASPVGPARRRR